MSKAKISTRRPCYVCGAKTVAHGLCDKHYRRFLHHGAVDKGTRPSDWGKRAAHPLYDTWDHSKKTVAGLCPAWREDFWKFVEDVGERPAGLALRRHDRTAPFSPENCYWGRAGGNRQKGAPVESVENYSHIRRFRGKHQDLRKKYGIGIADYAAMLEAQDNRCAICRKTHDGNFALAVDHCHDSKAVRGLLCRECNRGLGHFKDDPALLERAAQYLRKHHSSELPFT